MTICLTSAFHFVRLDQKLIYIPAAVFIKHVTLTLLPTHVWCLLPDLAGRQALERTAGPDTLILLGVTRTDTGPAFFDALDKVREGHRRSKTEFLFFPPTGNYDASNNNYSSSTFEGHQAP